jgi:membrane protease YdiL (CAAX protease family)
MAWLVFFVLVVPGIALALGGVRERFARLAPSPRRLWIDALIILAIWVPIEMRWLPRLPLALAPGVDVPVTKLLGLDLALIIFLLLRPLPGIGYTFRLTRRDLVLSLAGAATFLAVGIPTALAMSFAEYSGVGLDPVRGLLSFLVIYFFIAVPEELLFRGLFQNLIEQWSGRSWITLVMASVLFGAAHLNNATAHHNVPNFTYMLLASLAGVAYGVVWRSTGTIAAAAATHAFVDWVWVTAFRA